MAHSPTSFNITGCCCKMTGFNAAADGVFGYCVLSEVKLVGRYHFAV